MIEFSDINYKLLDTEARKRLLENYSQILNSFDPEVKVQLFLFNRMTDTRKVMEKFNVPLRNDGHDPLREEYSELLKGLYNSSTKGIRKSRYLIIGMEAKNLKEAELTVNSVVLKNLQTKGHLSVVDYDGTNKPVTAWALAETPVPANFNNTHGITSVTLPASIATGVEHGISNSEFLINNLIVMPQTLITSGQQLEINYTVNFSGESITHTRTIDLNKFDLTDMAGEGRAESDQNTAPFVTTWDPGKHYTYYLTINADLIVFNATISDWTDANAFHYIIN
jgi:hypothetical protein